MNTNDTQLLAAHVGIDAPHFRNSAFYNFPEESNEFENLFPTPSVTPTTTRATSPRSGPRGAI